MRRILILGPNADLTGPRPEYRKIRNRWALRLRRQGHHAILLETIPNRREEDLTAKFQRILSAHAIDTILVYWPKNAQMQSVYDELLILRTRLATYATPEIHLLHHTDVMEPRRGVLFFKERGRSRYMDSIQKLKPFLEPWSTPQELELIFGHLLENLTT